MDFSAYFPDEVAVTGQFVNISSFGDDWKNKTVELAEKFLNECKKSGKRRFIVALGGPSGSGKSVTSSVVEIILNKYQSEIRVISVSLDGYHYRQEYLSQTRDSQGEFLIKHKGRHDTFDTNLLSSNINLFKEGKSVIFPEYSRKIHNPISESIKCNEDEPVLLIIEGLWLLYDQKPWSDLARLYDLRVFFNSSPEVLKRNTVLRHERGGRSASESEMFYDNSDTKNTEFILNNIASHDLDFII